MNLNGKIITLVTVVYVIVMTCVGWLIYNSPETEIKHAIPSVSYTTLNTTQTTTQPTNNDYITQVDSQTSELNGEWLGLCAKDKIETVEDFHTQVINDNILVEHFSNFNWSMAEIKQLTQSVQVNVSHRKGDVILPSTKTITLPKGDKYITDGRRMVRTHCCNDIASKPQGPNGDDYQPYTPGPKDSVDISSKIPMPTGSARTPQILPENIGFTMPSGGGGFYPPNPPEPPPPNPPNQTPEPGTMVMLVVGLLVLIIIHNNRRPR
jgi:hypothetical protein